MSTTITITTNADEDFKTVVLVCLDKASGKYRSLNLAKRMIAPQLFDSPKDVIANIKRLKEQGRIKDFEVIEMNNDNK